MTKIKVIARVRPFLPHEKVDDVVSVEEGTLMVKDLRIPGLVTRYPDFAACYDDKCSHQALFEEQVEALLSSLFKGVTVSVFCYGVSSSGKTTTMLGNSADPGIIPRVVQSILATTAARSHLDVQVSVSYLEIYKDDCYDLLVPRAGASKLIIREDSNGKIIIPSLACRSISTTSDFDAIFQQASKARSTGATHLNHSSSRSHAMVTISVSSKLPTTHCVDPKAVVALQHKRLLGKVNLIDLAGSENNKSADGKDAVRLAESTSINKGLSVLGQVINAINSGAPRIPYRDCKLTRILKDALGGQSVSLLVCNLAPGAKFVKDTINTIQFATRTKQVQNKPVINIRDDRDEEAAVQSILFDNTNIFDSPQKRSGAANRAVFTMDDFNRKVEEEVQRRMKEQLEIRSRSTQEALNHGSKILPEHPDSEIRLDICWQGQGSVTEKDNEPEKDSCSTPQYNLEHSQGERAPQISFIHAQAESTRQLLHEDPPALQTRPYSIKGKVLLQTSEEERTRERKRLNKSIKVAIENEGHNEDKNPKIQNKVISRAYVAAARKALDRGDQEYALGLLQQAVSRNPQNTKLLEFTLDIHRQLRPAEHESSPKRVNQIHSKAQDRPVVALRVLAKHALPPQPDKPSTRPQESGARHGDKREESGKRTSRSRRKKVSWVDDTDYDYLEPDAGPSRRIAGNNRKKKVVEVIDVDGDSSEDDWLPRKAPPSKRTRKGSDE